MVRQDNIFKKKQGIALGDPGSSYLNVSALEFTFTPFFI